MSNEIKGISQLPTVTPEEIAEYRTRGSAVQKLSQVDNQSVVNSINDEDKYGDRELETALGSAASSATFGLSDQFLTKVVKAYTPEELKKLREQNKIGDVGGTGLGIIVPAIASGGTSLAAKGASKVGAGVLAAERAGLAAEKVSEKLLAKVLQDTGNKKLSKEIVKKSIAKGIGSGVEGSAYGAGQLIREDALGEADFNAENLLSYMGNGALLGSAIGTGIGVVSPLAKAAGSKISGTGSALAKKYLNPQKDAQKLFGFSDKDILKNPKLMDEVLDYSRSRLGLKAADDLEAIAAKNAAIKSASIKDLDDIYNQAGNSGVDRSVFAKIRNRIDEDFIKPYEGLESFKSVVTPVKKLVKDLDSQITKEGPITIKELRSFRQKIDVLAKEHFDKMKPSMKADAAFDARNLIRDELNAAVESINPELGARLKQANRDFFLSEKIEKVLDKKILKDSNALTFKDLVLGSVAGGAMGAGGIAVPAFNKFMESDLKRKITILSGIERSNKAAESKLLEGVKTFFKRTGSAAKKMTVYSLASSPIAFDGDKSPKDRQAAYKNTLKNIVNYRTEPEKFVENVSKDLMHIERAAPQASKIIAARTIKAMEFLESKIPKDTKSVMLDRPFTREYQPSSMELSKFERYVQIIDNPLSIVEELENGTITQEHADALKAVYPSIYRRLQVAVLDEVQNHPDMSYNKKLQLGTVMDIPTDESLIPENIIALQSNFAPQEEQQDPQTQGAVSQTQSGVSKLKISERQATDMQATQERKRS